MKRAAALLTTLFAGSLLAVDVADTRLLTDPAISKDRIAFAYANDLWTAGLDGGNVKRLTSHPGVESGPKFSPDGGLVAFTARYETQADVWIVPAGGGTAKRLTFHPANDTALGFTPDGKSVLFASPREAYTGRHQQLYTVPVGGGFPTKLPIPTAFKAAYSEDGKTLAYLPLAEPFLQWKNYRGGRTATLLLYDPVTHATPKVPQPAGRCNDTDPMWAGGKLYFRSDRDGEFNVYSYDPAKKAVTRVTKHEDFPVLNAGAGAGKILYEQAGYLHLLDAASGTAKRLTIGVPADLVETRTRWAKGAKWVRNAALSPSGSRVALEFRGEIVTLPREKGDDRNLTETPGAHERNPAWSPDGKTVAYFGDATGEVELVLSAHDGKGAPRSLPLNGSGFYTDLKWAPDSKKVSYRDNTRTIWILDVATGQKTKVATDAVYGPVPVLNHSWSPDSRFLAYTHNNATYFNRVYVFDLEKKASIPVTSELVDARSPVFDASGKYLYFVASTDAGPVADWFALSDSDSQLTESVYLAVLAKGVPSPLVKPSDEETPKKDEPAAEPAKDAPKKDEAKPEPKKEKAVKVVVDADGLSQRILAMPLKPAEYDDLAAGAEGQLFYRRASPPGADAGLFRYDLGKRKEDTLTEKADGFQLSFDGKRALLRVKDAWHLVDVADKLDLSKFKLSVDAIRVRVEPVAEWKQIYDEAWRINRDEFYDPGMHGADWKGLKARYAALLPHCATRQDAFRVIRWLHSELAVGHHNQGEGDSPWELEKSAGGLLGADFVIANGRYQFKTVLSGLNWEPELRAPLTEPGVDVVAGEYLLAVNGKDLRPPEELYERFERTAGRIVEITVGRNADGTGSRTVKVVPIEDDRALRARAWIEGNVARVTEASKGRVAYVWVPNTGGSGFREFKRYFYPQVDRDAIILDERYNGGGLVADYYIELLRRPLISRWAMRHGADLKTPLAGIHGPKVLLADESAGSGGDLLPWMFQKLKLGPVVGTRTWGGLVGILGFPVLMDGGTITAPNLAIWNEDGYVVENVGVPPDVEVEQTPADVIAGRDPQLEKALEIVMKELAANPVKAPKRPAFPIRVRK